MATLDKGPLAPATAQRPWPRYCKTCILIATLQGVGWARRGAEADSFADECSNNRTVVGVMTVCWFQPQGVRNCLRRSGPVLLVHVHGVHPSYLHLQDVVIPDAYERLILDCIRCGSAGARREASQPVWRTHACMHACTCSSSVGPGQPTTKQRWLCWWLSMQCRPVACRYTQQ